MYALPPSMAFSNLLTARTRQTFIAPNNNNNILSPIMRFAQPNVPSNALNMIAEIAQVVETQIQHKTSRTHKYASARHRVQVQIVDVEQQGDASSAPEDSPATSPSAAIPTTSTSIPISTIQAAARARMCDSRVFEEVMNDMLHAKDGKKHRQIDV
jgi:histone H3/H4